MIKTNGLFYILFAFLAKGEITMTNNKTILAWIDEMKALVNPDQVVWIDGSEEQLEELRK